MDKHLIATNTLLDNNQILIIRNVHPICIFDVAENLLNIGGVHYKHCFYPNDEEVILEYTLSCTYSDPSLNNDPILINRYLDEAWNYYQKHLKKLDRKFGNEGLE